MSVGRRNERCMREIMEQRVIGMFGCSDGGDGGAPEKPQAVMRDVAHGFSRAFGKHCVPTFVDEVQCEVQWLPIYTSNTRKKRIVFKHIVSSAQYSTVQ